MGAASLKRCCLLLPSPSSPFSIVRTRARLPSPSLLSSLLLQSRKTRPSSFSRALCSFSSSPSPHSLPPSTADAAGTAPIPARSKPSAELYLYNTMTKQKEHFRTRVPGKVGMYVCGVTAYDLSHIGHARVYVTFDVLYRYLQYLKYEVCYVRNFTDVDDKVVDIRKTLLQAIEHTNLVKRKALPFS